MSSDLLSPKEAADYLRVYRMTISRWVSEGRLHPISQGKKRKGQGGQKFTVRELNRFMREEGEPQWWRG